MTDRAELEQIIEELDGTRWHLDKKVPIALIITLIAQTFAWVWFGAQLVKRVEHLEVSDKQQTDSIKKLALDDRAHERKIAVIEESKRHISKKLDSIENKVDQILREN